MDDKELANRFEYHPPANQRIVELHQFIRLNCLQLAKGINGVCPDGREKSLAITKLEEVMFWANAAISRNNVEVGDASDN